MKSIKYLIAFLLIPALLSAKGFTINKPEKSKQPANTVERISKRTVYGKTFEADSMGSGSFITVIGPAPIHYDSAGKMVEFDFSPKDTSGEYSAVIHTGKFDIAYTPTGKIHFVRKSGFVSFTPAFDT